MDSQQDSHNYSFNSVETQMIQKMKQDISFNYSATQEYQEIYKDTFKRLMIIPNPKYNIDLLCKQLDLKTLKKMNIDFDAYMELQENSIKLQRKYCNHPNILNFYDYFKDKQFIYYYYEYCQLGNLHETKIYSESQLFPFFFQICLGLDYLHKNYIVHNEIKGSNILIDQYNNVKIKNFKKCLIVQSDTQFKKDFKDLGILIYEKLTNYKYLDRNNIVFQNQSSELQYLVIQLVSEQIDSFRKVFSSTWFQNKIKGYELQYLESKQFEVNKDLIQLLKGGRKKIFDDDPTEKQCEIFDIIEDINNNYSQNQYVDTSEQISLADKNQQHQNRNNTRKKKGQEQFFGNLMSTKK